MSKARAKSHTPQTETRITAIAKLMRAMKWETGITGPRLGKRWGLKLDRMEQLSSIASKRVRAELMADQHVGASVAAALDVALRGAVRMKKWHAVARVAKVYADAAGVSAPTRIEATIEGKGSPARAREVMRDLFGGVGPADPTGPTKPETEE